MTKQERKHLVRLLGVLQEYLETEIDSNIVPGTKNAMRGSKAAVRDARRKWKQAEDWVKKLSEETPC